MLYVQKRRKNDPGKKSKAYLNTFKNGRQLKLIVSTFKPTYKREYLFT